MMKMILRNLPCHFVLICLASLGALSCDDDDQNASSTLLINPDRIFFERPLIPITYSDATILLQNRGDQPVSISEVTLFEYDEVKEFTIISEDFLTVPQSLGPTSSRSLTIRWQPADLLVDELVKRIALTLLLLQRGVVCVFYKALGLLFLLRGLGDYILVYR